MTANKHDSTAADHKTAHDVEQYLLENPDFFESRHDLVRQLAVPHAAGTTLSLIEKQVAVLKQENHSLRRQISQLIANGRENELLQTRLHDLYLELMDTDSMADISRTLAERLAMDFSADYVTLVLFVPDVDKHDQGEAVSLIYVSRTASGILPEPYAELSGKETPYCGRLAADQLAALFPVNSAQIQSVALIPLGREECYGLLAIGSEDKMRFHADIGTTFLDQLGRFVDRVMWPLMGQFTADRIARKATE